MDDTEICGICKTSPSKYCCPRCNILYCSLLCYKSEVHAQCSESFYRENVIQEMTLQQDEQQPEQSSRKMIEILQRLERTDWHGDSLSDEASESDGDRFEEIDSDDGDDVPELAVRLGGVDLDDADAIWKQLTDEERKEFQGMLDSGNIEKLLPEKEPWWQKEYKVELIQSTNGNRLSKEEEYLLEKCPDIHKNIKNLTEISSKEPSPLIRFNLVNIIAAYAFVYRYFNGDFDGSFHEAANCLVSISGNLKANTIYHTEAMAVASVCHECCLEKLPAEKETSLLLQQDVTQILNGPQNCGQKYKKLFLVAAVSDVHRLFSQAKIWIEKERAKPSKPNSELFSSKFNDCKVDQLKYLEGSKLRNFLKKIEYMLSYAKDYV